MLVHFRPVKIKFKLIFILIQLSEMHRAGRVKCKCKSIWVLGTYLLDIIRYNGNCCMLTDKLNKSKEILEAL